MKNNEEIWKDIPGFTNYQVSSFGNVRSLNYHRSGEVRALKQQLCEGYCRVNLYSNGRNVKFLVHRLVAQAFIPNPENKPTVNHLDENPLNNNVDNLEWATVAENNSWGTHIERSYKALKNYWLGRHRTEEERRHIGEGVRRSNAHRAALQGEHHL